MKIEKQGIKKPASIYPHVAPRAIAVVKQAVRGTRISAWGGLLRTIILHVEVDVFGIERKVPHSGSCGRKIDGVPPDVVKGIQSGRTDTHTEAPVPRNDVIHDIAGGGADVHAGKPCIERVICYGQTVPRPHKYTARDRGRAADEVISNCDPAPRDDIYTICICNVESVIRDPGR